MSYFVGIDIGTSSVKVAAFSPNGQLLAKAAKDYPLHSPQPGFQEQDPELIFRSTLGVCKEVFQQLDGAPLAMSFSSAMHSLMALDRQGNAITPVITWADSRAAEITHNFKSSAESLQIYLETGTPIHPMSPLCKLKWFRKEAPELFAKADKWLGIKEYVLYHLTGQLFMDYSLASATGLFHLQQKTWHSRALAEAGISPSNLPELVPTDHIIKPIREAFATDLQIPAQTPIVIGASDGCLANLGAMALTADQTVVTIGTSAAIRTTLPKSLTDQKSRIFNYWLDSGLFIVGGASNNGGVVLDWYRRHFLQDQNLVEVLRHLEEVPPGADGLLFFPYLLGERAPLWMPSARGGFWGLSIQHRPPHFVRAMVEGICFNLYLIGQALEELGYPIQEICANGGFTQSRAWVQLLANIFGKTVRVQGHQEGSAFGAVLVAMKALGVIADFAEMQKVVLTEDIFTPDSQQVMAYQPLLRKYIDLYSHFKGRF